MKRLFLALALLSIPVQAKAVVCYSDAEGVRRATGMWPSWTRNMPGHKHEKCYYPVDKGSKQSHTNGSQPEPAKPSKPDAGTVPTLLSTLMSNAAPVVQSDSSVTNQESSTPGDKKEVMPIVSRKHRSHTSETRPQADLQTPDIRSQPDAVPLPRSAPVTNLSNRLVYLTPEHLREPTSLEMWFPRSDFISFEQWAKRLF